LNTTSAKESAKRGENLYHRADKMANIQNVIKLHKQELDDSYTTIKLKKKTHELLSIFKILENTGTFDETVLILLKDYQEAKGYAL
jgi:hypothetical protein